MEAFVERTTLSSTNSVMNVAMMQFSDNLQRDYNMVNVLTQKVIAKLSEETDVKCVKLWSDGCASQYKGSVTFPFTSYLNFFTIIQFKKMFEINLLILIKSKLAFSSTEQR